MVEGGPPGCDCILSLFFCSSSCSKIFLFWRSGIWIIFVTFQKQIKTSTFKNIMIVFKINIFLLKEYHSIYCNLFLYKIRKILIFTSKLCLYPNFNLSEHMLSRKNIFKVTRLENIYLGQCLVVEKPLTIFLLKSYSR